jgi:hypothetical protein
VYFNLGSFGAVGTIQRQGGRLFVPKPDGGDEGWEVPIRCANRMAPGLVQVRAIDMGRLPDDMQREGVGAHLLRLAGVRGTVVAEFHPVGTAHGVTVPLANVLAVWVRPEPGAAAVGDVLPVVLDFGGGATVRLFTELGGDGDAACGGFGGGDGAGRGGAAAADGSGPDVAAGGRGGDGEAPSKLRRRSCTPGEVARRWVEPCSPSPAV